MNSLIKNSFCLIIIFIYGYSLSACTSDNKILKIGVISDPHYLSEQLMDNGDAIKSYALASGKAVIDVPEVLDQVLHDYLNSDIEILLIAGDITKDGEKQSHLDFVKKLQPLRDKGVQIYVVPGNHDINMPNSVGYRESETYPVKNITPQDFSEIYADFGYNSAIRRDTSSLSYLAELDKDTWLLAIDGCRYKEYKDRSISGGKLSASTEEWIIDVLAEAKVQNIQVIGMMHHGLVEHIMMQATFFKEYIIEDWQKLAPLFADMGMKAIFTGHFHANDITEYISGKGNKIYDIETGSLSAYPFPYRFVELSRKGMDVSTKNILSTPTNPNLAENSKAQLQKQAERSALSKVKSMGIQLPDSINDIASKVAGEVFIKHIAGDEVMDENLKASIQKLVSSLDDTESISIENFKLDFYPADNNVKISFQK